MKRPNLIDKWFSGLPHAELEAVESLIGLARQRSLPLYIVGGPLRDLLLKQPSLDIDVTVEGDGMTFAREAADTLRLHLAQHPDFLTSTLRARTDAGRRAAAFRIDIATARAETYRRPGALPAVRPASIREDLLRRDFTINAMGLALSGDEAGELLDPAGGEPDLRSKLVRVLHDNSFVDDATRILRAARYEARFGFRLESRTESLLRSQAGYLGAISGSRIHHEVSRILSEPQPECALLRLDELGALARLHPALSFAPSLARAFATLRKAHQHAVPAAFWPLLAWHASPDEVPGIARRLAVTGAQRDSLAAMPALRGMEPRLGDSSLSTSDLSDLLSPHPPAAVHALAAATDSGVVRERCLDFLERSRHVRTALDGHDVLALGIPAGPEVGRVLRRLRVAKLNGEVISREDEERLVRALLAEKAGARAG